MVSFDILCVTFIDIIIIFLFKNNKYQSKTECGGVLCELESRFRYYYNCGSLF
jgi:hypothetical protein